MVCRLQNLSKEAVGNGRQKAAGKTLDVTDKAGDLGDDATGNLADKTSSELDNRGDQSVDEAENKLELRLQGDENIIGNLADNTSDSSLNLLDDSLDILEENGDVVELLTNQGNDGVGDGAEDEAEDAVELSLDVAQGALNGSDSLLLDNITDDGVLEIANELG